MPEKFVSFDVFVLKSREKHILKSSYLGRGTHVFRSGYACTSVVVRMYFGRGTHVLRSGYDDFMCSLRLSDGFIKSFKSTFLRNSYAVDRISCFTSLEISDEPRHVFGDSRTEKAV